MSAFRVVFAALLLPLCTGCLLYDRQSLVLLTPAKGEKAGRALMIYEGLHASSARAEDFEAGCKQLKELAVSQERCYAGAWPLPIVVAEPGEKQKELLPDRLERLMYKKNLRIGPATFFTDAGGRLCCYHVVEVPDAPGFLNDLNAFTNIRLLASGVDKISWLDEASRKRVRGAAATGHAWLSLEPGLLKLTMPLTPASFAGVKRDVLQPERFEQLVADLDHLINPKEDRPRIDLDEYKRRLKQIQENMLLLASNPVNIEQHLDRVVLALGLGDGLPIELLGPQAHLAASALEADKKFAEFARTLGRPFEKDVTVEVIRERFIQGKLKE
jgi:hypothetical protein